MITICLILQMTTPWDEMRNLDTGYDLKMTSDSGKVKADFKAGPAIGQYNLVSAWNNGDDMMARVRLDTPRDDFPYLQVLTSNYCFVFF